ncbi:hypothetical protein FACS1894153_1000 [Bacteroidia bacterium]|nr:hypothetical protein FACS1894153_1000 [Bacteroidia bacterium]
MPIQGQQNRKVIQISGLVMNNADLTPIPFVHVAVKGTYRGTSADLNGFFSLVTYAGDELSFTSIGFKDVKVKIPDTIVANHYTIYQSMQQDTIDLPLTVIYPWPSKEKFREAFLNLNVPDDQYEIARKNLTLAEIRERAKYTGMTPSMNYRNFINQQTDPLYYGGKFSGQAPANNLLNPFAWAKFLQIWKNQQDAKKKKAQQWYEYEDN